MKGILMQSVHVDEWDGRAMDFINRYVRRISDERAETIDKFLQKNGMTAENAKEFHLRITRKNGGEKIELFRLMPAGELEIKYPLFDLEKANSVTVYPWKN